MKARCILLLSDKMNVEYMLFGLYVYGFIIVSLMVGFLCVFEMLVLCVCWWLLSVFCSLSVYVCD